MLRFCFVCVSCFFGNDFSNRFHVMFLSIPLDFCFPSVFPQILEPRHSEHSGDKVAPAPRRTSWGFQLKWKQRVNVTTGEQQQDKTMIKSLLLHQ